MRKLSKDEKAILRYKMDRRNEEQYVERLQYHSHLELKYALDFLDTHNRIRKKRDYVLLAWGCSEEIRNDIESQKKFARPDFLLMRAYDNAWLIKDIFPIEVQTCSLLDPSKCYIKKAKIDRKYDDSTHLITKNKQCILFILGSKTNGNEKYRLLSPRFLEKIKQGGIEYPKCMGDKASYWFYKNKFKWRELYPEHNNRQLALIGRSNICGI